MLMIHLFVWSLSFSYAQLQDFPSEVFQFEIVEFRPEKGHHFELAATQDCSKAQVIEKSKDLVRCQVLEVGTSKVRLNICDDKKTFCKPNEFELAVTEQPKGVQATPLQKGLIEMKELIHNELLPGFENLNLEAAVSRAKSEGKPVLILISTDWCPPCNQSKEYLLSTKKFQELTKDWLKIYVDGDSADSQAYEEKLSFFEYPSFILVNSDFQEVSRFREELAFAEFKSWWERAEPYLNQGYEKMKSRVIARKNKNWWQQAQDFLFLRSEEEQRKDLHFLMETALAKNDTDFLNVTGFEDAPDFLRAEWLSHHRDKLVPSLFSEDEFNLKILEYSGLKPSYVYALKDICSSKLPQCEEGIKELQHRPKLILERKNRTEAENLAALADEHYAQMSFYRGMGRRNDQIQQARLCTDSFEKLGKFSELKFPRYALQGVLACAKEFDLSRVEKVYLDLMEKYPDDPTFILRYARFLKNEKKDLKRARTWVDRALDKSYDFNWFYAASLKVQTLKALGEQKSAMSTIKEAFSRLKLEPAKDSRNQQVLSRFRQLEQELRSMK